MIHSLWLNGKVRGGICTYLCKEGGVALNRVVRVYLMISTMY